MLGLCQRWKCLFQLLWDADRHMWTGEYRVRYKYRIKYKCRHIYKYIRYKQPGTVPTPSTSCAIQTLLPLHSICTGLHFTIGRVRICSGIQNRFVPLRPPRQPFVQTVQIIQLSNNRLLKFSIKSSIVNLWDWYQLNVFTSPDSHC